MEVRAEGPDRPRHPASDLRLVGSKRRHRHVVLRARRGVRGKPLRKRQRAGRGIEDRPQRTATISGPSFRPARRTTQEGADEHRAHDHLRSQETPRVPSPRSITTALRANQSSDPEPPFPHGSRHSHHPVFRPPVVRSPGGLRPRRRREREYLGGPVGGDGDYLTSWSILNIGRYIEITITPTIAPTPIIMIGSMIEVSAEIEDRKSTRLNSRHTVISYAVFCLK